MINLRKVLKSIKICSVICLSCLSMVLGCGTLPQGEVTATSFTVRNIRLSPQMVYTTSIPSQALVSNISSSVPMATTFLRNLVMNAVNDVLQEQGRSAFLPDAVITLILQQLNVTINYTPLECKTATTDRMNTMVGGNRPDDVDGCFIVGDFVASVCKMMRCSHPMPDVVPVPSEGTCFTENIRTSNIIMANWSRVMWQSVLNRVRQRLTTGSFGKYFDTAIVNN